MLLGTARWCGGHVVAIGPERPRFDVSGALQTNAFVREHGGPIRQGEVPDSHPASYAGTVTANTMALTVRLTDLAETIGSFTLAYGSRGRIVKCL